MLRPRDWTCSDSLLHHDQAGFANSRQAAMGTAVIPFLYVFYGFYDICLTILPTLCKATGPIKYDTR